jgi:hypothetical protein
MSNTSQMFACFANLLSMILCSLHLAQYWHLRDQCFQDGCCVAVDQYRDTTHSPRVREVLWPQLAHNVTENETCTIGRLRGIREKKLSQLRYTSELQVTVSHTADHCTCFHAQHGVLTKLLYWFYKKITIFHSVLWHNNVDGLNPPCLLREETLYNTCFSFDVSAVYWLCQIHTVGFST